MSENRPSGHGETYLLLAIVATIIPMAIIILGIAYQSESFDARHVTYSGVVVSDMGLNGRAHIVLSNSTGDWDVYCQLYRTSIAPTTSIYHMSVVVPSDPMVVIGLHAGQNVTITVGYYGCRVS